MELLNTIKEGNLEDYNQGGQVKLYHFAPVDESEITIDPGQFGKQSYSKREKERSSYPRSFYYVNLDEAESQVKPGKTLYSLNIPANKLYSMKTDPEGIVKSLRHPVYGYRNDIEWTNIFNTIHEKYDGAFYSTPSMDVVVLFEPYKATKVGEE